MDEHNKETSQPSLSNNQNVYDSQSISQDSSQQDNRNNSQYGYQDNNPYNIQNSNQRFSGNTFNIRYSSPQSYNSAGQDSVNILAIVSMILGIFSLVIVCWLNEGGILLGIGGIICYILSRKTGKSGMAVAGLVCSIIAVVLGAILFALSVILLLFGGTGSYNWLKYI